MITRDAQQLYANGALDTQALFSVLYEHRIDVERRLERLYDYYAGKHAILCREKHINGTANNKLVANHAKYITTLASGYLIGAPVAYSDVNQTAALDALTEAYRAADIDSIDAELAKHASIYGRGVELLYMDEEARPRTATIDPRQGFVVYSDRVDHQPILGVHMTKHLDKSGIYEHTNVDVYTDEAIYHYRQQGPLSPLAFIGEVEPHYFGAVPVNEYWNNEDETGDFEGVLSLIDAYNTLQSDRLNDKEQLVDALLVFTGVTLGDTMKDVTDALTLLREQRALELPATDADAKFLTKQLAENDVQVLSDSIRGDIFSMAMVPELTDANFAGNASGVAMRYKLLGLEQLTKIKERWFREALRTRMRMFANVLATKGAPTLDADIVQLTFTRSLPVNDVEQAQMVRTLQGQVPEEILLKQLSFVDDATEALKLLRQEREEKAKQEAAAFGYPFAQNNKAGDVDGAQE